MTALHLFSSHMSVRERLVLRPGRLPGLLQVPRQRPLPQDLSPGHGLAAVHLGVQLGAGRRLCLVKRHSIVKDTAH